MLLTTLTMTYMLGKSQVHVINRPAASVIARMVQVHHGCCRRIQDDRHGIDGTPKCAIV